MNSRRDFLEKLSASLIAFHIPGYHRPAGKSFSKETYEGPVLRVAIMGLGGYGNRVADAMQSCKRARLTGVISGTPSKIKDWQSRFNIPDNNCYNYENFDRIKDNPEIDAVYVITPN